jgi:lysophospholipase L1-like esterase
LESFENVLYRGRLYFLRVKPSTGRSISGYRLLASSSALDSVAALCKANNVKLMLFYAPVNPTVSLYRTPENFQSYRQIVGGIAEKYDIPLFDFENTISADHWGFMLSGPDPLHMGRSAQRLMAKQVAEAIQSVKVQN